MSRSRISNSISRSCIIANFLFFMFYAHLRKSAYISSYIVKTWDNEFGLIIQNLFQNSNYFLSYKHIESVCNLPLNVIIHYENEFIHQRGLVNLFYTSLIKRLHKGVNLNC